MFNMTPEQKADLMPLIKRSGDSDHKADALEAMGIVAKALTLPIREAILTGDIIGTFPIFQTMVLEPEAAPEFPLDLLVPGRETDFVAYTNTGHGYIPQRQIEGDYVMVPTYQIANAIDWLLKHARLGRIDIVLRAMQIYAAGFTKKINDDGWHTIITAASDRNIMVYDADASAGAFTKRLVSLAKVVMRRNGGGNSTSLNRGQLTDIFISPEGIEDIRNWGVDQIDEVTRREIFLGEDGSVPKIFGVRLHALDEFGVGQEYQLYFETVLGATVQTSDTELAIGLDLSKSDSFVMPIKQELVTFEDDTLHRYQKAGVYGWQEYGVAVLDNRRVMCLSY